MKIDLNLDTITSLLSFSQAVFLSVFLLTNKGGNKAANKFLAIFIGSYYLGELYDFLGASGLLSSYHSLIFFPSLALFFYGPAIYYYVKSITDEQFDINDKAIRLAFIPAGIESIAGLIIFFQPVATKIELLQSETFFLIHHIYSLIAGIHAVYYVWLSLRMVNEYKNFHEDAPPKAVPKQIKWFQYFLCYFLFRFLLWVGMKVGILIIGGFTSYNLNPLFGYITGVLAITSILVIYAISFVSFKHIDTISSFYQKKKYKLSPIAEDKAADYYAKIIEAIERDKKYLNPDYKIGDLAEELAVNSKYLSQTINKTLGLSFTQLLNKYRVEEVKQKLQNPSYQHLTILAIAEESGFKSKSTFTRVFQQHTGMLPKTFKEQGE